DYGPGVRGSLLPPPIGAETRLPPCDCHSTPDSASCSTFRRPSAGWGGYWCDGAAIRPYRRMATRLKASRSWLKAAPRRRSSSLTLPRHCSEHLTPTWSGRNGDCCPRHWGFLDRIRRRRNGRAVCWPGQLMGRAPHVLRGPWLWTLRPPATPRTLAAGVIGSWPPRPTAPAVTDWDDCSMRCAGPAPAIAPALWPSPTLCS